MLVRERERNQRRNVLKKYFDLYFSVVFRYYLNLNFDLNFKVMNLKYFDFKSKYKYLNFDLDLSYEFLIYVENFTNRHLIDLKKFLRRRLEKDFFFNEIWRKTLSNVKYITAIHFSQYPHHHHRHQHYWQVITIVTIANSSTPHFTTITILPNIDEFSKNLMFL